MSVSIAAAQLGLTVASYPVYTDHSLPFNIRILGLQRLTPLAKELLQVFLFKITLAVEIKLQFKPILIATLKIAVFSQTSKPYCRFLN